MFVTLIDTRLVTSWRLLVRPIIKSSNFRWQLPGRKNGRKLVRAITAESIYRCMLLFLDHILYRRAHFVRDAWKWNFDGPHKWNPPASGLLSTFTTTLIGHTVFNASKIPKTLTAQIWPFVGCVQVISTIVFSYLFSFFSSPEWRKHWQWRDAAQK